MRESAAQRNEGSVGKQNVLHGHEEVIIALYLSLYENFNKWTIKIIAFSNITNGDFGIPTKENGVSKLHPSQFRIQMTVLD